MAAERAAALRAAAAELERVKVIDDIEDRKEGHIQWAASWGFRDFVAGSDYGFSGSSAQLDLMP